MLNDMCRFHVGINCKGVQQCSMQQQSAELAEQMKKRQSLAHFNIYWLIRIRGIVRVFNQRVV